MATEQQLREALERLRNIGDALRSTNLLRGREIHQLADDLTRLATPAQEPQGVRLREVTFKWATSCVEGLIKRNIVASYITDEGDARDAICSSIRGAIEELLTPEIQSMAKEASPFLTSQAALAASPATVAGAAPLCWHKEINDEGICKNCGAKAAIKLERVPKPAIEGRGVMDLLPNGGNQSEAPEKAVLASLLTGLRGLRDEWYTKAVMSREESGRIRRTVYVATESETPSCTIHAVPMTLKQGERGKTFWTCQWCDHESTERLRSMCESAKPEDHAKFKELWEKSPPPEAPKQ